MLGGLNGLIATLLRLLLFNSAAVEMSMAGICIDLHPEAGGTIHIWALLGAILSDETALRSMFGFKGASGLKPCGLCCNVF